MNEYMVKGSSINSKIEFVKETFSLGDAEKLMQYFNGVISYPVLESSWYDYQIYVDILNKIAEMFYGSDIEKLKQVGIFSAGKVLNTVYKAYVKGGDFVKFLSRISMLHSRFYNMGKMEVKYTDGEKKCIIILKDAPIYSQEDNYIAAGFYMGSAIECGIDTVSCDIETKNNSVEFTLHWK